MLVLFAEIREIALRVFFALRSFGLTCFEVCCLAVVLELLFQLCFEVGCLGTFNKFLAV